MKFFEGGLLPLVDSVTTHQRPLYVQYYVTARCNLRCEQCNVIYANADQDEVDTQGARRIAKSLGAIGTSMVLLTGGEPFIRMDLPDIVEAFIAEGVHTRLQTNGLANDASLKRVSDIGAHDISISLDSLRPSVQDAINGGYPKSWLRALDRVSFISKTFPEDSFCAFGCVLAPSNFREVPSILRFATEIGWWVSLVPAHQTSADSPRSFSTYDPALRFSAPLLDELDSVLMEVKQMKQAGFNLYDSEEYLDDIGRFVRNEPTDWRRRNGGICDSPNLYFAVQPNGDMAICCDYRLPERISLLDEDFPSIYFSGRPRSLAGPTIRSCTGCMYGSFPEISVSARYFRPMLHRASLFGRSSTRLRAVETDDLLALARELVNEQ